MRSSIAGVPSPVPLGRSQLLRALLPLLVAAAAWPARAAVTVIQAGADSRTQVGIDAPDTVKQGPSGRSSDATADPYIVSTSDARDERGLSRVVDSAGSAVRFGGPAQADFFVRSAVNADAGAGDFQFPAHGSASSNAFYEFALDTASTLSFAFAASAAAQPGAVAYVALDVFTVDARTHGPRTYLRVGPLSGIGTLSYDLDTGSYGLSLTAFSEGAIAAHIPVNTAANSSAIANLSLSISAVPEPAAAAMWVIGLAGLSTWRARWRRMPAYAAA